MFTRLIIFLSWIRYSLKSAKRESFFKRWNLFDRLANIKNSIVDIKNIKDNINDFWNFKSRLKGICKEDAEYFFDVRAVLMVLIC
jgi:hypothetical protein